MLLFNFQLQEIILTFELKIKTNFYNFLNHAFACFDKT